MDSIEYYNQNATEYFEHTVDIDMQENWDRFISLLPEGGSVLDLGCGSGRDSAYFISRGFDVTAMDASEEMCDLASIHIGQDVLQLSFAEMDFDDVFDGIWACASLLHVPGSQIEGILTKVVKSLKTNGVLFMSFHYGEFDGIRDGRYYKDYRTKELKELISHINNLELIELQKCEDTREDSDIIWINVLARKAGTEY
ncbi:MAG TPA: class I SAM-dependent methyltransferase [Mobilitalea sp.]|nr:class I SAM-dependent methyltransferase [Mobilitalea sp.]